MARIYPTDIPSTIPSSEQRVLELLRDQLDNEYAILWSVNILSRGEGGRLAVGEADIVLFHRKRGLLLLEVKGGIIRCDPTTGQYWSTNVYGKEFRIKDPYSQALNRAIDLTNRIKNLKIPNCPPNSCPCPRGYAVVFPDCTIKGVQLPPNALPEVTLDCDSLDFMKTRIEKVYQHWAGRHPSRELSSDQYSTILHKALLPDFRLAVALSAELHDGQRRILRLTDEQCNALDMLDETNRALIRGPAGTGKTFLLMEKARRLAQEDKQVLILCYNRPLCEYLQAWARDTNLAADVYTFHHLCRLVIENAGIAFNPPKDEMASDFWKKDAPSLMFDVLNLYPKRWNAVLVDEAQDFDILWWVCVQGVLADEGSAFYIFYDPSQSIYDVEQGFPFSEPRFPVKTNCRNTRNICHLLEAALPDYEVKIRPDAPIGRIPRFINIGEGTNPLQVLDNLVNHLVGKESLKPQQITILSPHSQIHSLVAGRKKVGKYPLTDMEQRAPDAITFSSISRFKGLESDVVIVVDVEAADNPRYARQLHVAYSRAAQLLYVLHAPGFVPPKLSYEPNSLPSPTPS